MLETTGLVRGAASSSVWDSHVGLTWASLRAAPTEVLDGGTCVQQSLQGPGARVGCYNMWAGLNSGWEAGQGAPRFYGDVSGGKCENVRYW